MNTYIHLTSKDPEKQCNIIKPFTYNKLNSTILNNGNVRTNNAILSLKKRILAINNARQGEIGICCYNPVNQTYDKNILNAFRQLFPSVREIKDDAGQIKYLEVSVIPILDQKQGWKQLTPYHICKISNYNIRPVKEHKNRYIIYNLTEDCYTSNCDNQNTLTLEKLLNEETEPLTYTYYDDLKMYQSLQDANLEYIKSYLFKYNAINKILTHDDLNNYIIHIATQFYNKKIYDLLFSLNPNINVKNIYGNTPLHIACLYGHVDAINQLLNKNANVNIKNNKGFTPLMMAVKFQNNNIKKTNPLNDPRLSIVLIMVETLINYGANINNVNNNNETVLHILIKHAQTTEHLSYIVKTLLNHGIDVNIKNNKGQTALELSDIEINKYNNNISSNISSNISNNKKQNNNTNNNNTNNKKQNNKNTNTKENFQVNEIKEEHLDARELELKEIQTLLFNQMIKNNSDKYNDYINVKDIPKGAPIEVLNYVCSGDNPDIIGIEDKNECEKLGGVFTKVKNPTTKIKLELLPESEMRILSEDENELYYQPYPDSILINELPKEILALNQHKNFNNNIQSNKNNDKLINADIYTDRDNMIDIPNNFNSKNTSKQHTPKQHTSTQNERKNINNNMLLNNIETNHPEINSSTDIINSVNSAFNNSNEYMIDLKSNISKNEYLDNYKKFIKNNCIGIVILLLLIVALIKLFLI